MKLCDTQNKTIFSNGKLKTVMCNDENMITGRPISYISLCIDKQICITRLVWFYSRADWNGLNEAFIDYDWNICFTTDDINQISSRLTESFLI